jgi:hypothetical protein
MDGLRIGGDVAKVQMPTATKKATEGSAGEESKESQAAKLAEQQKTEAAKVPTASPEGMGKTVNLQA